MTPSGIEAATFRFVAQNQTILATYVKLCRVIYIKNIPANFIQSSSSSSWNFMTSTDAKKLERTQRKFVALCQNRFFTHGHVPNEAFLKFLKLHTPHDRRPHLDAFFCTCVYSGLKYCHLFWIILVFEFFLVISETPCSMQLPKILRPLDLFRLQTLRANRSIYLENPLLLLPKKIRPNVWHLNINLCTSVQILGCLP